ncbi:MAG: right-handed parallel beta-helix repeat-containing protein, partial [Planctomycetota bacterium]
MKKLIFAITCLLLAFQCSAEIIVVEPDGSGDQPTIQAAIDAAYEGDEVVLSIGTYTGDGNRDIDPNGKAVTIRSTNPDDPNIVASTVIDCNSNWPDEHRGFYFHSGEDNNSILDGLTIKNGDARWTLDGNDLLIDGGGILVKNSSPIIRNCLFSNNTARSFGVEGAHQGCGGGICCYNNANALITNCTFVSNNSDNAGAGIASCSSSPTISNCTINNNSSAAQGGGISCTGNGNPLIVNCTITNNFADHLGAGIFCFRSNLTILNCMISGNSAGNGAYGNGHGGGIAIEESNPVIKNCEVVGNYASVRGGGIYSGANDNPSNPSIINCTIAHNYAGYYNYEHEGGGGIACYYTNASITNSIVWNNEAVSSGQQIALFLNPLWSSTLMVSYCNIQGGQVGVYVSDGSTLDWQAGNIDIDPCFVEPGYWVIDPCISPYRKNRFWADTDNDYHLKSEGWSWDIKRNRWTYDDVTSRCIDAGNPGCPLGNEPMSVPDDPNNIWGENIRINMGAYGGTAEASIPPYDWTLLADLTNDGIV